ncbi:MAG: transcription termination/antitermination NusG family protein [Thermodesulfovibrionales bacterium]
MNWFAIYTKPKAEDAVARLLNNAGIETLNPKIMVRKYIRKKYIETVEQFFPCYIFALCDEEKHSHMIRYTRGVKYIVGRENPLQVPPHIIDIIRERMEGGIVRPLPEKFDSGERVLIKEGPFKDFYGVFQRQIPGKQRAMILLEALQFRLEVESRSISKV